MNITSLRSGRSFGAAFSIGCLLFFVAAALVSVIVIRVLMGPGAVQLSALPPNYPQDMPLYRAQAASSISYLPGDRKRDIANFLALPLRWMQSMTGYTTPFDAYATALEKVDSVTVTWFNLAATREEVLRYYNGLARTAHFVDTAEYDALTGTDSIVAKRSDASLQLLLQDATSTPGIDQLVITVEYRR